MIRDLNYLGQFYSSDSVAAVVFEVDKAVCIYNTFWIVSDSQILFFGMVSSRIDKIF